MRSPFSNAPPIPPFRPHPLLVGGHSQTLAGAYLPGHNYPYVARQHRVALADGDQLVLHAIARPTGNPAIAWHC